MENYFAADDKHVHRIKEEEKHPLRSDFDRDRDRIMYSKAFRRLSGKTQVFLAGNDDHVRTRLTHTLEVAQIARTISKALKLNEELTEAIALGHDIGHTPFGHVGERMLNNIMNGCYEIRGFNNLDDLDGKRGFKHNWQSIRVAAELEKSMNLTDYTLWGMLNHSGLSAKKCTMKSSDNKCFLGYEKDEKCDVQLEQDEALSFYRNMKVVNDNNSYINLYEKIKDKWSFEGYVVALADEVAQRHHDIEDGLEYKIIEKKELLDRLKETFNFKKYNKEIESSDLSNYPEFVESIKQHEKNFKDINTSSQFYKSQFSKFIVNILTTDIILTSRDKFNKLSEEYNIYNNEDFYDKKLKIKNHKDIISYSDFMEKSNEDLKNVLRDRILNSYKAQTMDGMGNYIIRELFKAYLINPQQLPDKTIIILFKNLYKEFHLKPNDTCYARSYVGYIRNKLSKYHFNRIDKNEEEFEFDYSIYKGVLLRTICDYISGMTDRYAIEQHRKLYNII